VVFRLKSAAAMFIGETLKDKDCPLVLHIKGENHLFSCYDVGENLLVFYTDMPAKTLEQFEITDEDAKVNEICEQLKIMLHGHAQT